MAAHSCAFWDCDGPIPEHHTLCFDHYAEYQNGEINGCPGCGRLKYVRHPTCLDCFQSDAPAGSPEIVPPRAMQVRERPPEYRVERSHTWMRGDLGAHVFYTYILKLDDGSFYAGHTRELRPRLMEHRDGATRSTAGRNPKLVWFARARTREEAATYEAELKELIDKNPREVRKMVIDFRDLIREVDREA